MTSTTANRHRMRCYKCKRNCKYCSGRFTLKRHPDKYKRTVKCPCCKNENVYSVEDERRAELARQERCICNNYPFPHNKGTLRMCEHHPLARVEPTEEEMHEYRACLETPRTGFC